MPLPGLAEHEAKLGIAPPVAEAAPEQPAEPTVESLTAELEVARSIIAARDELIRDLRKDLAEAERHFKQSDKEVELLQTLNAELRGKVGPVEPLAIG